ncbi:carbonic anhydrase [Dongia soli]|uniref:carbonic anhydrase n=1 Tax=Dongia soli TaxID=600628 RepID=A0ABU5EFK8_9PROT|nr:carbonic anhydrase [Dongia soli]MDY0884692.1 carbonic anhydrase [Dongia soli]
MGERSRTDRAQPTTLPAAGCACGCHACGADHQRAADSHTSGAQGSSRRDVLRGGFSGLAFAGLATAGLGTAGMSGALLSWPRRAAAQSTLPPDEALARLQAGNARFVTQHMNSFAEDLTILKQNTVAKQEPFAAILSCADSRVPVELIFDQTIGQLFVTRVAGNVATPEIIASLEYSAAVLGVRVIMVLGHGGCGAVKAAIEGKPVPGQISTLYASIRPAVDVAGGDGDTPDLAYTIKVNASVQAHLLATASPVLAGLIKEKQLKIVPAFYNLADGKVGLLV